MKERQNVLSSTLFIKAIEDAKQELINQQSFLEEAIKEPSKLFGQSDQQLGRKALLFRTMSDLSFKDSNVKIHDLQEFLAGLTNQFIQKWARENGITQNITVGVRNHKSYPSVFAIYHDEIELIQFDIFEKFYGIRDKSKSEEEIRKQYQEREKEVDEKIHFLIKSIQDTEFFLAFPHKYIGRHYKRKWVENVFVRQAEMSKTLIKLKNIWKLPFFQVSDHLAVCFKKTFLNKRAEEIMKDQRQMIQASRDKLSSYPSIEDVIIKNQVKGELTNKLIPLFQEFGFRYETERHNLY
ncbi:hypothetical protein NDS46_31470 (plasmid) [Paenibacillus thiaminolyticus]|uniref:hypothetical protein n=1 Tax=Paenibacillus thiaminolyticus TaxID=49283 RepID=UPI00232F04CD|nr:hypothetical protein [Paenibacillus thiaminolyticus]WCF11478.1 hypothetical protein NDS46_31470 [Paenibacillus thiaminolyticus]